MSTSSRFTNKLANEKSPYLLQHKHNPIEWYPWCSEAFDKAKELNRPIFLSVGYSTCHWCHVMEKESFENEEIARMLNKEFVCIKVDREERPDVDKLYMSFIQATTGHGGWPMTVFLTPELDPITGGTYFPPRDSLGSLGLPSVLKIVTKSWNDPRTREAIGGQGQMFTNALRKGDLEFLVNHLCWTKQQSERHVCRHMLEITLDAMDRGGIHDHVGKGFHRYSVDAEWHVPHFEKMLYDQTQLLGVYADFCQVSNGRFCHVVKDIVQYMDECLSHKDGGYYAAEDADSLPTFESSEKREGAFCVWKMSEIKEALKDVKLDGMNGVECFCEYYDIKEEGNVDSFQDPHGELRMQNVLRMKRSHEEFAEHMDVTSEKLTAFIVEAKAVLARVRARRPRPHLDSKMVCAWQGLAITGLSKASTALSCPDYVKRAEEVVNFVETYLLDHEGNLLRSAYRGDDDNVETTETPVRAFSDDYAMLIQGLLDLYQVSAKMKYLKLAERLQNVMDSLFWDHENNAGYFIADLQGDATVRVMEDQDGAEPCANSVAVGNLIRLFDYLDTDEHKRKADLIIKACSSRLIKHPYVLTKMISGYCRMLKGSAKIVVVGHASDETVKAFCEEINSHYIWNKLLVFLDPSDDNSFLTERCSLYSEMLKREVPTVFICANFTCGAPLTTVEELRSALKQLVE